MVLGELVRRDDGVERVQLRAVNACIQFLPTLDGKAIYTVESLKRRDGSLHPVQRALVDTHASQCGFCTPGFVMSLFALFKNVAAPDPACVADALSGNLCPLHRLPADHRGRRSECTNASASGFANARHARGGQRRCR